VGLLVLQLLLCAGAAAWLVVPEFTRIHVALDLERPESFLEDPAPVGDSPYGLMQWAAREPMKARLQVSAGDTVKLNLFAVDGDRMLEVYVEDRSIGSVRVDDRWRRFRLTATSAGSFVRLVPRDQGTGPVHCSDISISNVVSHGTGLVEWAVPRDIRLGPRLGAPGRTVTPLTAVVIVFLMVAVWRRLQDGSWGMAVSSTAALMTPGVVTLVTVVGFDLLSPHSVVTPWRTPVAILLIPVVGIEAWRGRTAMRRFAAHAWRPTTALEPPRFSRSARIALILFAGALVVFRASSKDNVMDSLYTVLVSENLIRHQSLALDSYFPESDRDQWQLDGRLVEADGHLYYAFPLGSSLLSIPLVAVNSFVLGGAVVDEQGRFSPWAEVKAQQNIAAALMAALVVILFYTARQLLPDDWAAFAAIGAGLGTQIWSTASRALWSHTWQILLLGIVILLLLKSSVHQARVRPIALATLVSFMYFVRPTSVVSVAAVGLYLLLCHRRALVVYLLTGGAWLGAFLIWSHTVFGSLTPPYYRPSRLDFEGFWIALTGHLVSPSRGILIMVPVTLCIIWLFVEWVPRSPHRPLARVAALAFAGNLVIVSSFWKWWGGHCYGPRFLTDSVPWLFLIAVIGLAEFLKAAEGTRERRLALDRAAAGVLLALSILINGIGANSDAVWDWNATVDDDPYHVWDWRRPQFLEWAIQPSDTRSSVEVPLLHPVVLPDEKRPAFWRAASAPSDEPGASWQAGSPYR
jgi:hypothetical protein